MLQCVLPRFVLVLRDFSLKMMIGYKRITPDEYLETSLENDDELGHDFNEPRKAIRKFFTSDKRKCFALPVPGDGYVLEKLEQLTFKDLSKRFQEATSEFLEFIFSEEPKQLLINKPFTGSMLAVLTEQYVEQLRNNAVPDVVYAFETVATMENANFQKKALEQLHKNLVDQTMPVPYRQLNDHFQRVQWTALEYIRNNVVKDTKYSVEQDFQSDMEVSWVQRKSANEQNIIELCENSLEELLSTSKLINGIQAKSYAVFRGHKQFKLDLERVEKQYHSTLKDKGYEDREIAGTWSTFIQTLAVVEMEIIQLDTSLSVAKKSVKEENLLEMQRMKHDMEKQNKHLLEEQRETYDAQQKKIENERDNKDRENQKKITELIQRITDLETDKNERQFFQKKVIQMEEEDKNRRKEERQWQIDEQRRRDEIDQKREEHWRQSKKDEKERHETTTKQLLDLMEMIQKKNEEKEGEREKLQTMIHDMEKQNKQVFEKQRKTYKAQQENIEKQRDKQDRENQENMTKRIQKIADLETEKNEHQFLQKRIIQMEEEEKSRRKEERQWRIDE
ncbi:guanylate-binding protein 1-like [Mya arenaria]|uniref:guanylate-binding protein 1-like n=1 Tax=Mya arenaria TaxID=6604 RepID=UPI0022E468D0|nr:guanylate-binding protein 1-like [Mya arenaria]